MARVSGQGGRRPVRDPAQGPPRSRAVPRREWRPNPLGHALGPVHRGERPRRHFRQGRAGGFGHAGGQRVQLRLGRLLPFRRPGLRLNGQADSPGRMGPPTSEARADLYADQSGFRLLEINIGSPAAGIDNADICRAMLEHPVLAEFADAHHLGYVDTMRAQVDGILAECHLNPGSFPMIVVADWLTSYRTLGPYLHKLMARWRELGLDAHACHVGELRAQDGRVWLRGQAVDTVFRLFMIEHLLESADAPALTDPILDAAARGEVTMFTSVDSDLFSSKAALAMLSDGQNRHLFTAAEQASIEAILPWTRIVRPGLVTLEDGRTVDLLDYAAGHADDLILKPAMLHSSQGVLPGWHPATSRRLWRGRLPAPRPPPPRVPTPRPPPPSTASAPPHGPAALGRR